MKKFPEGFPLVAFKMVSIHLKALFYCTFDKAKWKEVMPLSGKDIGEDLWQ